MLQWKADTHDDRSMMQNLITPIIYFGSLMALLIGAMVHLVGGGNLLRLVFSLVFALLGFWIGFYLAQKIGIVLFRFGPVDYGWSIIFSLISALIGYWLSGERKEGE